eukprot:jgi/Psemu1/48421/gm1.48421_g
MPSPHALSFSPTLTLPGEENVSLGGGGSGMAGGHPARALAPGTYLFIETKPGVLSATVCLPIETVTNEETPLEQWLLQRHTFYQLESVFRTVLTAICLQGFHRRQGTVSFQRPGRPRGVKAKCAKLDLIKTQVEERYPNLKLPTAEALEPINSPDVKAAFTALAGQLKEFQTHLIQSEMKMEELDLSSVDLQLTEDLDKLKAQPPALAKAKQDKATQWFNYFSPDLSKLSARIHARIMASLGGILEFFKACSTQTPGNILLDRISKLKSASLHVPRLSDFSSLSITPPPQNRPTRQIYKCN